jgi:hypothetical protein
MSKLSEYIKNINLDGLVLNALTKYLKEQKVYITIGDKRLTLQIVSIEDVDK